MTKRKPTARSAEIPKLWLPDDAIPVFIHLEPAPWEACAWFIEEPTGAVAIVRLEIGIPAASWKKSTAPTGGLQSRTIRTIRLEKLYEELARLFEPAEILGMKLPALTPTFFGFSHQPKPTPVSGRDRGDAFYAQIAAHYSRALEKGSRTPVLDISRALKLSDDPSRARTYAQELIVKARERKLLTKSPPGRPGGDLTPKARAILGLGPSQPISKRGRKK